MADGGHTFGKKTFHKPTYCHHCSDLLWGLIGQGYICEVCNFIIHERCVSSVVTPCSGIAPCIIKNPVAHCWSEPTHHKRKFCTVCRKRLDETPAVHCLVCEYFAHIECQDFAVPDCTENATYVPGKELLNVKHQHHWREGNLPQTSKCAYCKKTCWSSECLTGYRCEWCGMTTHGGCRIYLSTECNFGILQPIYLPPHSVSIPRTEVPVEAIIGVQVKSKTTLVRDYSCPDRVYGMPKILPQMKSSERALRVRQVLFRSYSRRCRKPSCRTQKCCCASRAAGRTHDQLGTAELRDVGCNESPTGADARIATANINATKSTTTETQTATAYASCGPDLSLRDILLIDRQRREITKQTFLLSSSSPQPQPTPPSPLPPPTTTTILLPTLTVGVEAATSLAEVDEGEGENEECDDVGRAGGDGGQSVGRCVRISPSASSSLHLLYTSLFRRMQQHGRRRKHRSSNTDDDNDEAEDEEDLDVAAVGVGVAGGMSVCDISCGDVSDEYDHCDVSLGKRKHKSDGGDAAASDVDYHGDVEAEADAEVESVEVLALAEARAGGQPQESFYETSDTGGELTTTDDIDIDSSTNLISSNLSYNSSNSNTSIENRRILDRRKNAHNAQLPAAATHQPQLETPTAATSLPSPLSAAGALGAHSKTGAISKAKGKGGVKPSIGGAAMLPPSKSGSVSSPHSSDCSSASPVPPQSVSPSTTAAVLALQLSPVGRSKSFQEQGVRQRKYSRFFQRRRSKRSNKAAGNNNFSPDNVSKSIEIRIQDEDGNYQPYDDNYYTLSGARGSGRAGHCGRTAHNDEELDDADVDDDVVGVANVDNRPHSCGGHSLSDDVAGDISDGGSSIRAASDSTNPHMFGRLLKRMRRLSLGWRKPRYHKRRARSISEEFSSGDTPRFKDEESVSKTESTHGGGSAAGCSSGGSSHYQRPESAGHKSDKDKEKKEKEREEKDIEMIKVFDGNNAFRRQLYRVIFVQRTYTLEQLLTTALRAFHITRDPSAFYLTDLYAPAGLEDSPMLDPNPVLNLIHVEGKRPAIYLRFHDKDKGFVRVYPGKLQCSLEDPYVNVSVDNTTVIKDLIRDALDKFGLPDNQIQDYRCSEVLLDRGVTERILSWNERPWDIMKQLGKDSIRQMELMRFYMQHKQDPHGPNIALFVGNLPPGLSQRNYEQILNKYVTDENKFTSIGPIYYEYGSVVLTFEDSQKAVRAFYNLRETIIEDKKLLVMLLPNIEPSMVPSDVRPLLVFVNVKSGGCQGLELISSFRKLLNPFQVFDLDNGGPLPGLYVFRQITNYKILVCGGDGTIGWVLQCLDNVGQDSECSSPPCAIVPLGTGNDLARVLCWGSGYTGGEDPLNLLRDVIEAEEIRLDRWTVVFHPEDKPEEPALKPPSNTTGKKKKAHQAHLSQQTNQHHQLPAITSSDISGGGAQNEDNSQIFVMNNYFGIGIDADLCLDFHNAREENPNKFNSRLHNKGYYVKMGLRKIVGRKTVKDLHKELRLEVDGKVVELPPVEGIIILNILSWGSGANPWGPDKDDNFTTPNHYDGVLEIVGVTGVVHLGQIQSGIRTAMRIAQGGHIKIHLYSDMPVQVDGEPWVQSPGDVVVLKSALKATMLKKNKGKMKRRNTEPTMIVAGSATPQMSLALPPLPAGDGTSDTDTDNASNNTDF